MSNDKHDATYGPDSPVPYVGFRGEPYDRNRDPESGLCDRPTPPESFRDGPRKPPVDPIHQSPKIKKRRLFNWFRK